MIDNSPKDSYIEAEIFVNNNLINVHMDFGKTKPNHEL